jgi:hypothetical protein
MRVFMGLLLSGYVKRTVALPLLTKTRDKGSEISPNEAEVSREGFDRSRIRRRYTATGDFDAVQESSKYAELLERETGFEPATLSLGTFRLRASGIGLTV